MHAAIEGLANSAVARRKRRHEHAEREAAHGVHHPSDVQHIRHLVQTSLGGTAVQLVDRSPGYSGSRVYAADVAAATGVRPCIVKLVPDWGDEHTWPAADQRTNWVYGAYAPGVAATYALLQQHAIPIPQLYGARALQPDMPMFAFLMERLAGDDVERVRRRLRCAALARCDAVVGAQLGTLHRITRGWAGRVDQPAEAARPWRETFFTAFTVILERACIHAALAQRGHRRSARRQRNAGVVRAVCTAPVSLWPVPSRRRRGRAGYRAEGLHPG